ncbi:MAG: 50S ribosomal protein L24e [Candidatus Aenigmarchaeota archaeon]|nr:50S ribosomal protein L24e [Candidatus Aenigmarchaeota archaeon]
MPKCSFCSKQIEQGTGMTVIKNDGKLLHFDSKKCQKSMLKLHRDPRNIKWVTKQK